MQLNLNLKWVISALGVIGIITFLVVALVRYEVQVATERATTETIRRVEQENQKQYGMQIEKIQKESQAQIEAIQKETEAIKDSQTAMQVLIRNIPNAKPIIVQVPAASTPTANKPDLPDAPQPQVKKDNLLCYDEPGQIELAKFSQNCRETSVALDAANKVIAKKNGTIASKDNEIRALEREKHPGFFKRLKTGLKHVACGSGSTVAGIGVAQKDPIAGAITAAGTLGLCELVLR